jgi:aryl-alcohol dehydrogenase-like predicted oxidoreductase
MPYAASAETRGAAPASLPSMERTLGATGLRVSPIGLGLAALGRPGYLNVGHGDDLGEDKSVPSLMRRSHEVLDTAYDEGVRYFDAARSYGHAEDFLASWLARRHIEPGSVTVGSKWGYTYTAAWQVDADPPEVKDLSAATLRRQLGETRERLGPWLSLYQIHSATVSSGVLDDPDVGEELERLRADGVAIGLTVTGAEQAETIERALAVGRFDCVQATYNLLERSAGPALERAHGAGMGVIVKEALANGRLTRRGGCAPLRHAAEQAGASEDAVAIAWLLAHPWVDLVLSGAATPEQLTSNLAGARLGLPIPDLAEIAEPSDRYWASRSELAWT